MSKLGGFVALVRGIVLKFCSFWGIPCKLLVSRANDDVLFLRACARAKCKATFYQKLPIWVMMAPLVVIFLFKPNDKLAVALMYLFPTFLVGVIAIVAGTLSATRGSIDIQTRNEYSRLLRAADAADRGYLSSSDTPRV